MTEISSSGPVLEAKRFSKTFGDRTVLKDVSLTLQPGEVHGLLGENGSGKSTLIKILSGFHAPDPGAELRVRGKAARLPMKVTDPARMGIGFVHQELALFEDGSVLENIRVGRFATGAGWRIPWRAERRSVSSALASFGLSVGPDTPLRKLGAIERAMVAIVRALDQLKGAEQAVLVLDEPTCYLPDDGVHQLFGAVREVASRGIGVLFVTHRLEEVRAITDRLTVLRDGSLVATVETSSITDDELVEKILGFALTDLYPETHPSVGEVALEATGVTGDVVTDVSLGIRHGEVVGVTGLVGMGFDELPYLLFGVKEGAQGAMHVGGKRLDLSRLGPRAAIQAGVGMIPADRPRDGAVPDATVTENMTLLTLGRHFHHGRLNHREELAEASHLMDDFDVRPRRPRQSFGAFSGGNQQKALLAKWLTRGPAVMLMHEPTQGVDIGARRDIFGKIRRTADSGTAIMIASAEYEDLVNLCDRVLVFRRGQIVSELSGSALTYERLLDRVLRGNGDAASQSIPATPNGAS